MKYSVLGSFLLLGLALGCGGGGGTAAVGSGGGVVTAGPLRVEGQVNSPQSAVTSGVTTHTLTGNITAATLNDASPTTAETEILYSTYGANRNEIAGVNAGGDGDSRTIIGGMTAPALGLWVEPADKFVYYIRNGNLQRTDIRDGTSNTILAGVSSFVMNQAGSKICYTKVNTDEVWSANANGSGQVLVRHLTTSARLFGFQSDTTIAFRDVNTFQTFDLTNGTLGLTFAFTPTTVIHWAAFSPSERTGYFYIENGAQHSVYRAEVPVNGEPWNALVVFNSTVDLIDPAAGPGQNFVGVDSAVSRLKLQNSVFSTIFNWPYEGAIYSIVWGPNRTSFPLIGAGSSFPGGAGALLCTELGMRTPSVVTADAVTRSSIAVTSLNDTQNGNPLYRIDCDNLKSLAYASGNAYIWKKVVDGASGLKGAVVSFDSSTGLVANIVTFTKKPVIARRGKGWKVEGDLAEVISVTGGTHRPAGHSTVLR